MDTLDFFVRKDQLATTQLRRLPEATLADGQVRVRIDAFALTSNNITYAAFGDAMNYWQFFPVDDAAWGRIPVWGFGTVQQSRHADVAEGELVSSASSKTAYGTAFQLAQREGIEVIGLTSAANVAFCKGLGCYHRVLRYDELEQIAADAASVYVDFAGNADLRRAIHTRFANLKYSCAVARLGATSCRAARAEGSCPPASSAARSGTR